jgi:thiol-disulfide isomerase/thioredoxin
MINGKTLRIGLTVAVLALLAGIYAGTQRSKLFSQEALPIAEQGIGSLFASTLIDARGKPHAFTQWKGKTLVVNFWATWCPPCREEMPAFSRLQTKFASNGVQFVGIALDSADSVLDFSIQNPATYPLLIGGAEGTELARQLGNAMLALPYTLIITPAGTLRLARMGGLSESELDAMLRESTAH